MGNLAVQLMSDGSIGSISEARKIVSDSSEIKTYTPVASDEWETAYNNFIKIVK